MGNGFAETSVNKIDPKKYEENFNKIDWSKASKEQCDCHEHERQVCDICQCVTGSERDKE